MKMGARPLELMPVDLSPAGVARSLLGCHSIRPVPLHRLLGRLRQLGIQRRRPAGAVPGDGDPLVHDKLLENTKESRPRWLIPQDANDVPAVELLRELRERRLEVATEIRAVQTGKWTARSDVRAVADSKWTVALAKWTVPTEV